MVMNQFQQISMLTLTVKSIFHLPEALIQIIQCRLTGPGTKESTPPKVIKNDLSLLICSGVQLGLSADFLAIPPNQFY